MEDFSLLFPQGKEYKVNQLTPEAVNDLSIDFLLDNLTDVRNEREHIRNLLTQVTDDEEVIRYRGGVFEDFLRFPKLRAAMEELVARLADLKDVARFQKDQEGPSLWSLINRLREVDEYVSCITMIKKTLEELDVTSEGMKTLRRIVTDIDRESGFPQLKADIDETMEKARKLKSITIGVNLDDMLRPKSAGVLSLNDSYFTDAGLMRRFMNFTSKQDGLHEGTDVSGFKQFHAANPITVDVKIASYQKSAVSNDIHIEANSATGSDAISNAITKPVTSIMKKTCDDIKSTLKRYVNISGYMLISLMPEIIFYVRWAELIDKIIEKGMPVCKAEILSPDERYCSFKEIYNLKLAINNVNGDNSNIIRNDISLDDERRIYILTGPNRGGKTIFTQAVGLAMMMAQWGVYVPAEKAVISPCDNMFTHFPADENDTVDLGRLGEESKRLSEIFDVATSRSFMLLNESLATTSVAEGLFIAKDVVKAMRYLGVRCIFNTHMHELARSLDELNGSVEGESRVESLVTGVQHGERSFKVAVMPPQGVSYAKDIAEKYGVTFDKIKQHLEHKSRHAAGSAPLDKL